MYLELHAASAFSFLDGASLPSALVERAAALGYPALALLDRDGMYGAPQFYRAARAAGIRAIVGAEVTMAAEGPGGGRTGRRWTLPVLVASAEGYRRLCRLISQAHLRAPKGAAALTLDDFAGETSGLVALIGHGILRGHRHDIVALVDRIVGIFGRDNVRMELQRHLRRDEQAGLQQLLELGTRFQVPVMASNGVRFATPGERPLYDVLTCIRHHTTLARAGRRLTENAERHLKSPQAMARLFSDLPEALAGTAALAERLEFTLADLGYRFPTYPVPDGGTQDAYLRQLVQAGARDRYRPYHDRARAQIERELALIAQLDLAGYFLIVWDIIRFCREQRILVQGRGSAANSAVCYALGITAVDPVGMDLLFERFLSAERREWPDIDLDLPSGERRERVIQYVYQRYGRLGAAMTANVISYRGRSAARELGKVLDLDAGDVGRLAKAMTPFEFVDPADTLARHLREAGLDPGDRRYRQFATLWGAMQDLPRHLSQHSGGMVLCQGRLDEVVPIENAAMPGRVVVQWDKDDCADLGLIKVDLLGLGMMAVLEEAIDIVNGRDDGSRRMIARPLAEPPRSPGASVFGDWDQSVFDLARMETTDTAVYDLLTRADTVGVFQVESRAQMATLPRLRPRVFYDLVVEVAIIRPGPIVGNMVHPYFARRDEREPVTYPHPSLEPVLKRTKGVPLFQEQLLRMAMIVAGFSGGEAEELRRAMGFKRSVARMRAIETRLREGMAKNGITGAPADRVVEAITSFALFGFPESHAASFALLAYASAFLKVHHAEAFYTALLNNQPMGFYHPATLVKDAQRRGVRFAPIDVQVSAWNCVVQPDGIIRMGLRYVRGLREGAGQRIAETTGAQPPGGRSGQRFSSLDALVRAADVRQEEMRALAEAGALASFGGDRRTALWQAERAGRPAGPLLSDELGAGGTAATAAAPLASMTLAERVRADYDTSGLSIGPHPMAFVRASLTARGVQRASDLPRGHAGRRVRVAGAVITRQRPGTAKGFVFLSMEDESGIANVIVQPDVFDRFNRTIVDEPYLIVDGILQNQHGVVSVKAERIHPLRRVGPVIASYDFH
ncbi:MAG: error-prone DNA polymerase [Acidobacteria bacterium SCN 69-37]|nr:MAG: error-prone DNA polymerase [Acidobacteria bacterium SCN 69-37]